MKPAVELPAPGPSAVVVPQGQCAPKTRDREELIVASVVLVTLTIVPFTVIRDEAANDLFVRGVGSPTWAVTTYLVALVGAVVWSMPWSGSAESPRGSLWPVVPLVVFVFFGSGILWPSNVFVTMGALNLLMAAGAWAVGGRVSNVFRAESSSHQKMAAVIFGIVCIMGVSVYSQVAESKVEGARQSGLFGHPATIGKLVVILLVVILPMSVSQDRKVKRLGYLTLIVGTLATIPTLSRANIIGLAIGLLVWSVLLPRHQSLKSRLTVPVVLGIGVLPFLSDLIARFQKDPDGGERPALLVAGLRQIHRSPWVGTGPNYYVQATSLAEPVVAQTGALVHNSGLLAVAELGLPGAAVFLWPVVLCVVLAVRKLRTTGTQALYARSTISAMAAMVFIGNTGWGFLAEPVLQLVFFVLGVSYQLLRRPDTREAVAS